MKKMTVLLLLISFPAMFYFITSCRHQLPLTCNDVHFKMTAVKTDALLNNSNGTIRVTASGGQGFKYSLDGRTFKDTGYFAGLAPFKDYTIIGNNSMGCSDTVTVTIGSFNPCQGVTINITTTKTDAAANQSNGSITASATGGTGFTYSLNGGVFQNSGTFSNLAAGNYTITAKSADGCTGATQVTIGAVDPCAGITVAITTTTVQPTTGQSNGSITAAATGGSGFTYSMNGAAYQASGAFANLAAGTYTITAKNSNGCIGTALVTLIASNACSSINITITQTVVNVTPCISPANGSITVTASGSTGFTYNNNGGAYQASNIFSALGAGTYLIGVKDANGCTKTQSVTVGTVAQGTAFAAVRTLISARCSGGGCHMNGGNAAGYNFDADCSIVSYWNQINGATVTGTLKKMPLSPQAALTAAEKQIITTWVNAGHRYTD